MRFIVCIIYCYVGLATGGRCASVLYFDLTCVGGKKRPVSWWRRHSRGVFQCKLGFLEVETIKKKKKKKKKILVS